MDKILSRKMFRQKYLETQKPLGFQKGGVATLDITDEEVEKGLGLEKTEPKEEPESYTKGVSDFFSPGTGAAGSLSRNERMITLIAPIAAALLTGDQRTGESKGSGTLRALGLGLAQLPGAIATISKSDLEARKVTKEEKKEEAELATTTKVVSLADAEKTYGVDISNVSSPGDVGTVEITYDPALKKWDISSKTNLSVTGMDQVHKLRKTIDAKDKKFIVSLNNVYKELNKSLKQSAKYNAEGDLIGYDIPGQGHRSLTPVLAGDQAKTIQRHMTNIIDLIARERSGATLTEGEEKRFREILGTGWFRSDLDLLKAVYDIGQIANEQLDMAKAGFSDEVINQFFDGNFSKAQTHLIGDFLPASLKDSIATKDYSINDISNIADDR